MFIHVVMKTVTDIFDFFGGAAALSRVLNCNPSTASEMKRRKNIPVENWKTLIDASDGALTDTLLREILSSEVAARKAPYKTPEDA